MCSGVSFTDHLVLDVLFRPRPIRSATLVVSTSYPPDMDISEFLGLNVIIVGSIVLVVLVYLVFLINKRRKARFLHRESEQDERRDR
jgi:hypothetical protein